MAQREKRPEVREACSVAERSCETVDSHAKVWATGDKPHAAIARRCTTPSSASVDQTGSQPRMISESRCRAKLHGIFKQAQRRRDGRLFLLLGGPGRLVGCQIAPLSSLGIVVLSGVLNSTAVRNVLRGWITHGDIAALWMTQPLALSTVSSLLEACQQAAIAGVYADFHSETARHLHAACMNLAVRQMPVDLCAFDFPFKKRLTFYTVSVPVYLKQAQRCHNFDHVCSFAGQAHQCWKGHFIHRAHRLQYARFIPRVLVHLFHAKNSWTNKHRWLG